MTYTIGQITEMAAHIRSCEICCLDGDPDIIADTYAENLPPEGPDGYIESAHRWAAKWGTP
ncbi:hypothetical protein MTP10_33095 [Nonomuraea sp. 3-1Str]|uniref:hypothetical protein n=1 Tax=Nonomuraea sp. 3-1Str TaxID=2929801 RepID=UPI00286647C2|nr:hypothetical protein [Nonomuraea sp. 3-1Str]MDR8413561.1 hypothetical protein [Nonomuraea sp. 3-1Str]